MKIRLTVLLAVALCGCAVNSPKNGNTYDQIKGELDKAQERKPAVSESEAVNAALLPPLKVGLPKAAGQPGEARFDLVVNNAPANQVFMAIVSGTRFSMLVHPETAGNITLNLKDVTVFEALEAIRELYGYEYKVDGERIYIQPIGLQTRVFQVNYLPGVRRGDSEVLVSSSALTSTGATTGGATGAAGGAVAGGAATVSATPPVPPIPGALPTAVPSPPFGAQGRGTPSSRVATVSTTDFWDELRLSLLTMLGLFDGTSATAAPGGAASGKSVVVNPLSGVIVVRATPLDMRNIATFLKASQLSVERQVILEAKILEVRLNDGYQAGINWAAFKNLSNTKISAGQLTPGSVLERDGGLIGGTTQANNVVSTQTPGAQLVGTPLGFVNQNTGQTFGVAPGQDLSALPGAAGTLFGLALRTSSFAALLSFLETQGNVHVLSSPRIATVNNQSAVLKVGTDEFFVTNVQTTASTASGAIIIPGTSTVTVQPFFSGIALDVTPRIDENGAIILHIHPSVSQVNTVTKSVNLGVEGTITLPLASSNVSETDSIVRAEDGQIVAIGGLMRQAMAEDRSGVPGLASLPFVGALFRQTNQASEKRELVILLKPTVVKDDQAWSQDILDTRKRVETLDRGYSYGSKSDVFGAGGEEQQQRLQQQRQQ